MISSRELGSILNNTPSAENTDFTSKSPAPKDFIHNSGADKPDFSTNSSALVVCAGSG
jgi:hypothetical protein